ncbi:hypothetical protein SNEBB_007473 [Seison nebaliae]|nr:hypothetical protein SNEBB_007473 [Seison nebaliae]
MNRKMQNKFVGNGLNASPNDYPSNSMGGNSDFLSAPKLFGETSQMEEQVNFIKGDTAAMFRQYKFHNSINDTDSNLTSWKGNTMTLPENMYNRWKDFNREKSMKEDPTISNFELKRLRGEYNQQALVLFNESSKKLRFRGQRDAQSTNPPKYFAFIKNENSYTVHPIEETYQFTAFDRFETFTMEEAEEIEKKSLPVNYSTVKKKKQDDNETNLHNNSVLKSANKSSSLTVCDMEEWVDDENEFEICAGVDMNDPSSTQTEKNRKRQFDDDEDEDDDDLKKKTSTRKSITKRKRKIRQKKQHATKRRASQHHQFSDEDDYDRNDELEQDYSDDEVSSSDMSSDDEDDVIAEKGIDEEIDTKLSDVDSEEEADAEPESEEENETPPPESSESESK